MNTSPHGPVFCVSSGAKFSRASTRTSLTEDASLGSVLALNFVEIFSLLPLEKHVPRHSLLYLPSLKSLFLRSLWAVHTRQKYRTAGFSVLYNFAVFPTNLSKFSS